MATIRQEINILNSDFVASGSSTEIVQLDTNQYNGKVSYYFEIVANNTDAITDQTVNLQRSGTATNDATLTVVHNNSSYAVYRSTAFTPPAGTTNYVVNTVSAITSNIKAARIVV